MRKFLAAGVAALFMMNLSTEAIAMENSKAVKVVARIRAL